MEKIQIVETLNEIIEARDKKLQDITFKAEEEFEKRRNMNKLLWILVVLFMFCTGLGIGIEWGKAQMLQQITAKITQYGSNRISLESGEQCIKDFRALQEKMRRNK